MIFIVLLVAGAIYATFASNPMSFDDLIEFRFLRSRRRQRDLEYYKQLKSMILRGELSSDWRRVGANPKRRDGADR
jgi:hypothetical protein